MMCWSRNTVVSCICPGVDPYLPFLVCNEPGQDKTKRRANVDRVAVTDAARTLLVDVSDRGAHISLQTLQEGAAAMTTSSGRAFPRAKVLG
jgi:hypothetical protein